MIMNRGQKKKIIHFKKKAQLNIHILKEDMSHVIYTILDKTQTNCAYVYFGRSWLKFLMWSE